MENKPHTGAMTAADKPTITSTVKSASKPALKKEYTKDTDTNLNHTGLGVATAGISMLLKPLDSVLNTMAPQYVKKNSIKIYI